MFEMDERLIKDTVPLGISGLCHILLMNDSRYPWVVLVPHCSAVSEVFELSAEQQQQLWQETTQVAELLKQEFQADKINIATLGNVVKQLHMHIVVRMQDDASWPDPVWGKGVAQPYSAEALGTLRKRLLAGLAASRLVDKQSKEGV